MFAPRSSRRVSAFTLIELLTVIAIVGILAGILIPVVGRVRSSARMISDISNLREIGKATALYWAESKNTMPHSPLPGQPGRIQAGEARSASSGGTRFPVYETIDRYFPKKPAFNVSGSFQYQQRATWFASNAEIPDGATSATQPYGNFAHFAFNPNIWAFNAGQGKWNARMSNVPAPSQTVLMAESNDPFGIGDSDLDPTAEPVTKKDVAGAYRITQPGNKGLYLWADLHVSALVGNQNFTVNPGIWRWWNLPSAP
jgi:prepilin-type N-terminal cleavage/methylation domain-containing protein